MYCAHSCKVTAQTGDTIPKNSPTNIYRYIHDADIWTITTILADILSDINGF